MLDNIKIVKFLCWQFKIIVDSKQIFNIVDCNKKYCDKMEKIVGVFIEIVGLFFD